MKIQGHLEHELMKLQISFSVFSFSYLCCLQPWESQSFCSTFPYEIVCADSWGQQSLLAATDTAGVMLLDGEFALINIPHVLPDK